MKLNLCLIQTKAVSSSLAVLAAKMEALTHATETIAAACKDHKPDMIVLPEMFCTPYGTKYFKDFGEPVPEVGKTPVDDSKAVKMLVETARKHKIWLVGGSVPELSGANIYNTCVVVDPEGLIVGKHRKVHLFDIDIPGKQTFKESDVLSPGSDVTVIPTPWGSIGVAICYDMRFPELAMCMRKRGAKLLVYPGAFNATTGPMHWKVLVQGRATDNQCYVAACAPALSQDKNDYQSHGHSMVAGLHGDLKIEMGTSPGVECCELDMDLVDQVRQNIPISFQKRHDLYDLVDKKCGQN
eukprot:Platyproteum_vivax@DN5873_c0_g1_i2.p1